ncbi:phytanoyl-CoA dioxygenase family protein [Microlunatus parietis]|uniref:Phytanoyl-CoA dioxygenase (PhyH) n=1 Tax=Microlunatus parietis TaxID=682979 RepID=A0A7Y9IAP4_9ACTN|nr:phytanoyl-CoA dioxygenase family protein [Microlunatus parietis]NYE73436.1 hypothetical protein [Microlunatus parietis]
MGFGDSGIIRVDGAFPGPAAAAMSDLVWQVLGWNFGFDRADRSTWGEFRKRPLAEAGAAPIFEELLTDRLAAMVDDLLGEGGWEWPSDWGDFLITFPGPTGWRLPHEGWHQDWGFDVDCDPVRWVKAFAFLNEVRPGGGGTPVVTGSHRLVGRYGSGRARDQQGRVLKGSDRLYDECGYLRDLGSPGDPAERRRRFMERETDVDGVGLRVVELTGRPGDVVLIHPWLVHAVAPNAAATPRFMRAPVFRSR